MEDFSSFPWQYIDGLQTNVLKCTIKNLTEVNIEFLKGISVILAKWDSNNEASNEIPSVFPPNITKVRGKEFSKILQAQKQCLNLP